MSYSREDIIRMVREEDVKFIRMQFTDIFGQLKNVAITASQIEKAVDNQIMIDSSSIEGFVRINEDQLSLRDRSMVTIAALFSAGLYSGEGYFPLRQRLYHGGKLYHPRIPV